MAWGSAPPPPPNSHAPDPARRCAGGAAGAVGLAWLRSPPFLLRFPTCKIGRRAGEGGAAEPAELAAPVPAQPVGPIAVDSWLCAVLSGAAWGPAWLGLACL